MRFRIRGRRRAALAAAATTAVLAGVLPAVTAAPPAAAAPGGDQSAGPWSGGNYQPQPGKWQPYVLAPDDRDVEPVAVLSANPRGGAVQGEPKAALGGAKAPVRLVSYGDRTQSPLLTLDFGKDVGGKIRVHVAGASKTPPQLHVCFSESKQFAATAPQDNSGEAAHAPGCDTANIWNGYPGTPYTYDSDSHTLGLDPAKLPATLTDTQLRGGFRYATVFLDGPGWVDIDGVSLDFGAAPKQADPSAYKGWFLSSDNELNKIWYAGAYTVQLDTWMSDTAKSWPYQPGESDHADAQVPHADPGQEVIFDGAKRDRIVWQGDLAVQAPVTYLSTGDVPAVDNSLSSLAAQQLPDGYMPGESLVGQHNQDEIRTYGEYVTWFIHNHYTHWLYTADRAYLDKWWPALTKAAAWLEAVRAKDPQGLIAFQDSGSCGHYGYSDCGHETYVNALYARNLEELAALAGVRGADADPAAYASRATALKKAVNDQLWDDTAGAYRLSRETPDAYPQDANATAVLTGIASPDRAKRAMDYLRRTSWSTYGALTVAPGTPNPVIKPFYEPLPSGFEADARLNVPDPSGTTQQTALQMMRTFWGHQLAQDPGGTFWEKADLSGQPGIAQFTSLAHGWASGPTVTLTNQVLGVQPTGPGFSTYAIVPHPGDLHWAQGAVPTPHGDITASWQSLSNGFELNATTPTGTTGRLAVPTRGTTVSVTLDGHTVWDGSQAVGGAKATTDGVNVYLDGVAPGRHTLRSHDLTAVATTASVAVTPETQSAQPGSIQQLSVTVGGAAAHRLSGTLTTDAPDGWVVSPADREVQLTSDGSTVSATYAESVYVPAGAASGDHPIRFTFTTDDGVTARTAATLSLSSSTTRYDFEDDTQGWQAGQNVTSVARTGSFANGPGRCLQGQGCLEATSANVPASATRSVFVAPDTPLDLSQAKTFTSHIDAYGGAPGADGYQAVVTLTGDGGQQLTRTLPMANDTWNTLQVDIGGWAARDKVSRIEIGFHATGSDTAWTPRFQIDGVGWTTG